MMNHNQLPPQPQPPQNETLNNNNTTNNNNNSLSFEQQVQAFVQRRDTLLYQYRVTECGGLRFMLPTRYQLIEPIGQGGFGCVASAYDHATGEKVAIKKIVNLFEREKHFQKKILRELKILRHLRDHDNIVCLRDLILPPCFELFKDVYIVTNLMDFDLNRLMRNNNQPFTEQSIQYFLHQILRGLKYIHSAEIIHRDLKPENILLNQDIDVMICDFGLSRSVAHGEYPDESKYVVTRWYRAPEVILFWDQLNKAIDVWSVGCIFAELLCRPPRQVFLRGSNFKDQLDLILRKCGTPSDASELKGSSAGLKYYFDHYANVYYPRMNFRELFPDANPLAVDLLERMLQIDPDKRITVDGALAHPYLEDMHDEADEILCPDVFSYSFPAQASMEEIRQMMYDEIVSWHNEQRMIEMDERKKLVEQMLISLNNNSNSNAANVPAHGEMLHDHTMNISGLIPHAPTSGSSLKQLFSPGGISSNGSGMSEFDNSPNFNETTSLDQDDFMNL